MNVAMQTMTTPLGPMRLTAAEGVLIRASFVSAAHESDTGANAGASDCLALERAGAWLSRYFAGEVDVPSPFSPAGTSFQRAVWNAIARVPHGRTATYADIARAIGAPRAVRAVGAATGRNPLWIFIPCHRIIGSDGALTGYAGGIERKQALLALERNATLARAA